MLCRQYSCSTGRDLRKERTSEIVGLCQYGVPWIIHGDMTQSFIQPDRLHDQVEGLISNDQNSEVSSDASIQRLTLLWDKRRFLARVTACGLLAGVLLAFVIPKRFTSTARLMPPDEGRGTGMTMLAALAGKAGPLGSFGGDLLGLKTTGDLFIGILQSRTVQDEVITKFDLRKVYEERQWADARTELARRTQLSQDRKNEIITIAVTDRSPQRAQQIAEEYVAALNDVVVSLNTSSAHREREFLEGRLNQVQKDLEAAETKFSDFSSKNSAIDIEAQGKAMITETAGLEGQLVAAQTELQGLKQIYSENNVRVRATQARVSELQRQIRKLGGEVGGPSNPGAGEGAYPTIRQLPILGVTYADLYRRLKVEDAVFQTLTQQYEAAKVEEAKETPSVKVLDPPDFPERKSFPPRGLIILLGIALAFPGAVTWVLAVDGWQRVDSADKRKVLVKRVWTDIQSVSFRNSTNGNGIPSDLNRPTRLFSRFRGHPSNGLRNRHDARDQKDA
jgi:uncharacterized protein involved in exopolysaccharide biosynthesis